MILTGFFPLMSAGFLEVMDTNLKEYAELSNCLKMWSQREVGWETPAVSFVESGLGITCKTNCIVHC